MFGEVLNRNYNNIIKIFLSYLPSRLLVVLNALVIVPILAHIMSSNEIGIFQLSIGILNLVCTCSTDWIAKSVLRFYEKYRCCNKLDEFFSNTILVTISVYLVTILLFLCFSTFLSDKLLIQKSVLFITLLLVLPVGVRQVLYQMLRVLKRPYLYTFSIVLYQVALLALFLLYTGFLPNVWAALFAMLTAILGIDIYILKSINLNIKFGFAIEKNILFESLKYALPQIITNTSIWAILNFNKFVFQYHKMYEGTAVVGVSYLLATSILTPIFSTFLFAIFPTIIKKFESKYSVKLFLTNSIQLYCALFIPIVLLFCYFSREISQLAFSGKYSDAATLIPFIAVTFFFHELMKLFNIKYHLKNRTYIEMAVSLFVGLFCIYLNYLIIPKGGIIGSGLVLLLSMLMLFILNIFVRSKDMDFINHTSIIKTSCVSILITLFAFIFAELLYIPVDVIWFNIFRIVIYLFTSYLLSILFVKKLLNC